MKQVFIKTVCFHIYTSRGIILCKTKSTSVVSTYLYKTHK